MGAKHTRQGAEPKRPAASRSAPSRESGAPARRWLLVAGAAFLAIALLGVVAVVGLGGGGKANPASKPPPAPRPVAPSKPSVQLRTEVIATYPHDPRAYTQGLLEKDGVLYESTGLHGASTVRRVELETGKVEAESRLFDSLFGEGLALVGDQLVQLTWENGKALVWDAATLEQRGEHRYEGEGWGLCFDGRRLVMSDGSDFLTFRDPETFAELGRVQITRDGVPVDRLNELECVGEEVYANRWQLEEIVRLDPASGQVTATIDAVGLLHGEERARVDVLNGIAYRASTGTFLLTGKFWPKLFEVRFVPVQ
jgi:glutaminyl-peptide cyclotransferase